MRQPFITTLIAAVLLPLTSFAEEGDWGAAEINFVKVSLSDEFSLISRSQFVWRNDFSEFYFWYADAGLAYSITPTWRVELGYRHAGWRFGEWLQERRPFVGATWSKNLKGTRLTNHARLEFRDFQWNRREDFRFRNSIRAEFPWDMLPGGIKPFIEEEFFYSHNRGDFEMNWLTGGLYFKPAPKVKLKAGYRLITIRAGPESRWENRNQIVTGLALFF